MGHNYKNYRPDIDGLRAVAVSLVVLGHAFPQYVPGGFVGVDIFFVISGYLITGIIYGDIQNGSFSLATFYARRIRRIFPALIVVLIAAFIAGWQLLMPSELVALGKEIAAGAGFSANLLFYSEGGYFDAAAQTKPLLHLWSLGIEEQFYLVWPLLLWALMRWRIAAAAPLALIFIASLVANILVVRTNPEAAFYQPFTRAWELAAGALVAVCLPSGFSAARDLLGWSALAVIAAVTAFYSPSMTYPGIAAVAPVAAAAALIMSGRNRFLSTRTAVAIGLISYPLYLWHWPILVFAASFKGRPLTLAENGLAVGASFILAWATYRYVERPIRFGQWRVAPVLAASMVAVASVGALAIVDGFAFRLPAIVREAGAMTVSRDFLRYGECHISASADPAFDPSCVDASKRPLVFVWGDSTAGMLAAGLRQVQGDQFGLAQFTVNSCPPLFTAQAETIPFCVQTNRHIVAAVARSHPDVVLLHLAWSKEPTADDLRPTIVALRQAGAARVVLVGPVPVWTDTVPHLTVQYFLRHHALIPERSHDVRSTKQTDDRIGQIAADLGIEYLSPYDELCNADGCLTRVGTSANDLVSADFLHLSPRASRYLAAKLVPRILAVENRHAER
ncbi:acyltransferase family protein [Bradyrhizobium sp. BRP56]|uniref:acyltransferase family protein n=1 Tax=Bradyrhizobium sp. BRP56 TaxID=2793819 RepID=UPI001CD42D87|nr:acyltransferase family protein [Bradyrhizobium sp. BRP56]